MSSYFGTFFKILTGNNFTFTPEHTSRRAVHYARRSPYQRKKQLASDISLRVLGARSSFLSMLSMRSIRDYTVQFYLFDRMSTSSAEVKELQIYELKGVQNMGYSWIG